MEQTKTYNVHVIDANRLNNGLLQYYLKQSSNPTLKCSLNNSFSKSPIQEKTDKKNLAQVRKKSSNSVVNSALFPKSKRLPLRLGVLQGRHLITRVPDAPLSALEEVQ